MVETKSEPSAAEKRGRKIGIILYALVVSSITGILGTQIIWQALAPASSPTTEDCRTAVEGLLAAVRRARGAAALEVEGEKAAVDRFRQQLAPEWNLRPGIGEACKNDPNGARALQEVDLLRYAEEHAVRYDSVDVARRRRTVQALESQFLAPQTDASPNP